MPSLTLAPSLPIPETKVKVSFSGLNSATNYVRLIPKIAPEGSGIARIIDQAELDSTTPAPVFEGKSAAEWDASFEVGGIYTFRLFEETRSTVSARFDGDTQGAANPSPVADSDVTIVVGTKLTLQVGQQPHTATVTVFAWGDYVRPTTIGEHGIVTPKIESTSSPEAIAAVNTSAVISAVAALSNATFTTILGDLQTTVWGPLVTAFNGHIATTPRHTSADPYSTISAGLSVSTPQRREKAINEFIRLLGNHMNSTTVPDPSGDQSDPPLTIHGAKDGVSVQLILGTGRNTAEQYSALADASLSFSEHVDADSPIHGGSASAYVIPTTPLFAIHLEFQRVLRSASPTIPSEVSGAVARLTTAGGFTV